VLGLPYTEHSRVGAYPIPAAHSREGAYPTPSAVHRRAACSARVRLVSCTREARRAGRARSRWPPLPMYGTGIG